MRDTLSPQLFAILAALVEERTGLHFRLQDADVFASKVLDRMREAGFESPLDYYYRLRYEADPSELSALVDALVVGETYFFRELDALRAAIEHVVRPAINARGGARIWCAACATGEEPLSLAMLLHEETLLDRCILRATDVSARALTRARLGQYGRRAFRAIDASPELARIADRWITRDDDVGTASPTLLARIDYRAANLMDPIGVGEEASFDLVLCRNVLIYFSDATVLRVVGELKRALRPDGRVLVGASESLLRFPTGLRCEERRGAFFYAKGA